MYFCLLLNNQFVRQYPYRGNLSLRKKVRISLFIVVCLYASVNSFVAEQFFESRLCKDGYAQPFLFIYLTSSVSVKKRKKKDELIFYRDIKVVTSAYQIQVDK